MPYPTDVWSCARDNVWVVGSREDGTAWMSNDDGHEWTAEPMGIKTPMYGIWSGGGDNLVVAGNGGAILRRRP